MKSKVGIVCIVLGVLLLLGALLLALFNMRQDAAARKAAEAIMSQLVQQIQKGPAADGEGVFDLDLQVPVDLLTDEEKKMSEVVIDGYAYIGYLSMPTLDLELPVMSTWSYPQMKLAPCRYNGSIRGEDLVIMAHNYSNHFGKISQLSVGDNLSFTDADGVTTVYTVVAQDIVESTAVEEVTDGTYDLTLFTCTYGGGSRVTVYCNKA
jgi:sortase A